MSQDKTEAEILRAALQRVMRMLHADKPHAANIRAVIRGALNRSKGERDA